MNTRVFRALRRSLLGLVLLVLVAGLVAPFINAAAFSGHIRRALESSLGRPVQFEQVHFTLFSGPGFSLDRVSIGEDPRFGLEPFAYVPTLEARIRVGALLRGHLAFDSLKLVDPSLNIVKTADGACNVVEIINRLAAPSRLPVDLFPAFSVSGARLDFKLGIQKTTLYVTDTDVNVYPQRSGKLYVTFSGSPARTDREGNGFGHIHGTANWYLQPASGNTNQLEAQVSLDRSNLSELTTLIEGEDAGVHGTIASHASIEGPLNALRISGDLELADVHRWDLLPSATDAWNMNYGGLADLQHRTLSIATDPGRGSDSHVSFQLNVHDFLSVPTWSMVTSLKDAPATELLPLATRMGMPIPANLKLSGTVNGAVGFDKMAGLSGEFEVKQFSAELPGLHALRTPSVVARISPDSVRFDSSLLQTETAGTIAIGGEYQPSERRLTTTLEPIDFPVNSVRDTVAAWFGETSVLNTVRKGLVTGKINFEHVDGSDPEWAGQFRFTGAELLPPGLATPLTEAKGQVRFDNTTLDLEHCTANLGSTALTASYHYDATAKVSEHIHLDIPEADLNQIEAALSPALQAQGLFARLGVARREIPAWLAARRLQGDVRIGQFSVNGTPLGTLQTHVIWNGPRIHFSPLDLDLPDGTVEADGTLDMSTRDPHYQLDAKVNGLQWRGGLLNAEGSLQTSGMGADALGNLQAQGTFSVQGVTLATDESFNSIIGDFQLSLQKGWVDLHLSGVRAEQGDLSWTGDGATKNDGKLILDLQHEGQQRRVVSSLDADADPVSSSPSGESSAR